MCPDAHGEDTAGSVCAHLPPWGSCGETGARWLQLTLAEEAMQPRGDEMI